MNTVKEFTEALKAAKPETKPYDTTAEVVRIDGSTAWVHIPGGVDETPVQLTIAAQAGDTVNVRVSGGRAWITGNGTRPPTDDTRANAAHHTANVAQATAEEAQETAEAAQAAAQATKNYFWHDADGAHVSTTEGDATTGPNVLIDVNGMTIRLNTDALAAFMSSGVTLYGSDGNPLAEFNAEGMKVYGGGLNEMAHLGYGECVNNLGQLINGPYFTFGERNRNYPIGLESVAEGQNNSAEKPGAHAEGSLNRCAGIAAHVGGFWNTAGYDYQTVIGKFNDNKSTNAFEIGWGTDNAHQNIFEVDTSGNVTAAGEFTGVMKETNGAVTDLDDATANGIYTYANTASNIPTSTGGTLLVMAFGTNYIHQLALPNHAQGTSRLFTRMKTASGWGAWTEH